MSNLVEGRTGEWEVVIGLEVHAQVSTWWIPARELQAR